MLFYCKYLIEQRKNKTMFRLFKKNKPSSSPLEQNRNHHKELKKGWDSDMLGAGLDVVELEEVVVSGKGVPYYAYKDISTLVMSRKSELIQALRKLEYVVNPKWLVETRKEIKRLLEKREVKKAQFLLNEWEKRETQMPEKQVLMEVASVFFVRFDENPYTLSHISQSKKMEEVEEDFVLQNFFLSGAWEIFKTQLKEAWLAKFNASEIGDLAKEWTKKRMEKITTPHSNL